MKYFENTLSFMYGTLNWYNGKPLNYEGKCYFKGTLLKSNKNKTS